MSDTECSWCNHSAGRLRGRARNGKPQQMLFLSSLLAFVSASLGADTREGHKCWRVLIAKDGLVLL